LSGTLYGWGKSSRNRFGLAAEKDVVSFPTQIPLKFKVKEFSCGYWHSLVVSTSLEAYSCGDNKRGALGLGDFQSAAEFTKIPELKDIEKVSAGSGFSLFVNSDGSLFSCGRKEVNGHGSKSGDLSKPAQVESMEEKITYIDSGVDHAAAITESGKLYTWGSNSDGQLGFGPSFPKSKVQYTPKEVSGLADVTVVNVSCSKGLKHCHTACVDSDGNAYFWGCGYKGKLGNVDDWNHKRD